MCAVGATSGVGPVYHSESAAGCASYPHTTLGALKSVGARLSGPEESDMPVYEDADPSASAAPGAPPANR